MALIQEVKDGQIVDYASETESKKKAASTEMGEEQFLQLLVTQMQYQDPLEPTNNTEWVAQMATFSMVESLNDMKDAMSEQSANGLVGKYVLIKETDSSGNVSYAKGKVDYITVTNGKTKLSVDDKLYDLSQLDTVADEDYYEGSVKANELKQMIGLLPLVDNLTASDDGLVKSAREEYEKLTETQKKFVDEEDYKKLVELETRMNSLKATHFTHLVDSLPSVEEINAADEETLAGYGSAIAEASDYYNNMTELQKKNVAEETLKLFHAAEDAANEAAKKFPTSGTDTDTDSGSETDVSAILQKILEEIRKEK